MNLVKTVLLVLCIVISASSFGQTKNDNTISLSYFGENVRFPGLRAGIDIPVGTWGNNKDNDILVSPSVGFFYHRRYQTSYFMMADLIVKKKYKNGFSLTCGTGMGSQLSYVPNTFFVGADETVYAVSASRWFFLGNVSASAEKEISLSEKTKIDLFVKPILVFAYPHFPKRLTYTVLEIGFKFKL